MWQSIFRRSLLLERCLYYGNRGNVESMGFCLVVRAGPVCARVLHKECQCLGLAEGLLATNILRREEEKTFMEKALETSLITLQFRVELTQPGSLFKPPLIDHLPRIAALR